VTVEEAVVVEEKTSFTIKLEKFEASAKAKMIREIKGVSNSLIT
jgi:ribosomal protein L7/L12